MDQWDFDYNPFRAESEESPLGKVLFRSLDAHMRQHSFTFSSHRLSSHPRCSDSALHGNRYISPSPPLLVRTATELPQAGGGFWDTSSDSTGGSGRLELVGGLETGVGYSFGNH
jgi:hypothetical protein